MPACITQWKVKITFHHYLLKGDKIQVLIFLKICEATNTSSFDPESN